MLGKSKFTKKYKVILSTPEFLRRKEGGLTVAEVDGLKEARTCALLTSAGAPEGTVVEILYRSPTSKIWSSREFYSVPEELPILLGKIK